MSKSVEKETRTQDGIIFPKPGVGLVVEHISEARRREIKHKVSVPPLTKSQKADITALLKKHNVPTTVQGGLS